MKDKTETGEQENQNIVGEGKKRIRTIVEVIVDKGRSARHEIQWIYLLFRVGTRHPRNSRKIFQLGGIPACRYTRCGKPRIFNCMTAKINVGLHGFGARRLRDKAHNLEGAGKA